MDVRSLIGGHFLETEIAQSIPKEFDSQGGILIGGTLVACFLSRRRRLERERLADELEKSALEDRLVP